MFLLLLSLRRLSKKVLRGQNVAATNEGVMQSPVEAWWVGLCPRPFDGLRVTAPSWRTLNISFTIVQPFEG